MKRRLIAGTLVLTLASLIGLPVAAGAQTPSQSHTVATGPCQGLGIDIALGSVNYCIPL
ncbi:MAG: hypothetical protein ACRDV4_10010 [Acidimicrobiales bacterium]